MEVYVRLPGVDWRNCGIGREMLRPVTDALASTFWTMLLVPAARLCRCRVCT